MYLFMGNMRATLIPTIAVPVVLLGTFAALGFFGFNINMLTMFAMVLAIGLLVDDAIVVVENVERIMSEEGLSPKEATAKSMDQITPALIGIGLVLSAVFGPMAFFGGSTGVIYRQFSVTIVASMLLSVLVALILTPVLCASFLKPVPKGHEPAEGGISLLRPFFRWFDHFFFGVRDVYVRLVGHSLNKNVRYVFVYVLIVAGMGFLFLQLRTSYLPDEDQGVLLSQVTLPVGSTLEQTEAVMAKVRDHFLNKEKDAVESIMTISGQNMSGRGQNIGMAYIKLKDWKLRTRRELKVTAVAGRAMGEFSKIRNAMVFVFPPPAVVELGAAKGIDFQLQDRGGLAHDGLMVARRRLLDMAAKDRGSLGCGPTGWRMFLNTGSPWIWKRPVPWGFRSLPFTIPFRRPLAAPMSTTLSKADGSSTWTFRPTPPTGCCPGIWKDSTCATRRAKWFPIPLLHPASGPTVLPS